MDAHARRQRGGRLGAGPPSSIGKAGGSLLLDCHRRQHARYVKAVGALAGGNLYAQVGTNVLAKKVVEVIGFAKAGIDTKLAAPANLRTAFKTLPHGGGSRFLRTRFLFIRRLSSGWN